jgi:hypothetical protein
VSGTKKRGRQHLRERKRGRGEGDEEEKETMGKETRKKDHGKRNYGHLVIFFLSIRRRRCFAKGSPKQLQLY